MFVDYDRADKNITEKLSIIDVAKPAAYVTEERNKLSSVCLVGLFYPKIIALVTKFSSKHAMS